MSDLPWTRLAEVGWHLTFLVLDASSVEDRQCIPCCNARDVGEKREEQVLKSAKMPFAEAAVNIVSFEMMTLAPSESNKNKALNAVPPVWVDTTDTLPGELKGNIATPEYARAAKRREFLRADVQGVV